MKYEQVIIDDSAKIAEDVTIGPWTRIGPRVQIQSGVTIGSHCEIKSDTYIGEHTKISSHAAIGGDPQHIGYKGEETALHIGQHNDIREFVTINRGTAEGGGVTRIGDHNFIMAYSHVAHDCQVGNHNVFANNASCAGHVTIGNYVVLGAFAGIHQFCRVADYSFLGRATKINHDIIPYVLVTGNPGFPRALNSIGLRRAGFTAEERVAIKRAFHAVCRQGLSLEELKVVLTEMSSEHSVVKPILEIVESSKRGIARGLHGGKKEEVDDQGA